MTSNLTLLRLPCICALLLGLASSRTAQAQPSNREIEVYYLERATALFEILNNEPLTLKDLVSSLGSELIDEITEQPGEPDDDYKWTDLGNGIKALSFVMRWTENGAAWHVYFFNDTIYYIELSLGNPAAAYAKLIVAAKGAHLSYDIDGDDFRIRRLYPERAKKVRAFLDTQYGVAPMTSLKSGDAILFEKIMFGGEDLLAGMRCGWSAEPTELYLLTLTFIGEKNVDALLSMARGVSPAGRVMAAVGLLQMEKNGIKLPVDMHQTIAKIRASSLNVDYCSGCIIQAMQSSTAIDQMLARE